jgi:L-aminopeptidase/D-esterase-like protein
MAQRVALMAHDGFARAVWPAHTLFDGDTLFVLATGRVGPPAEPGDANQDHASVRQRATQVNAIGVAAAETVAQAIVRAIRAASPLPAVPAAGELPD